MSSLAGAGLGERARRRPERPRRGKRNALVARWRDTRDKDEGRLCRANGYNKRIEDWATGWPEGKGARRGVKQHQIVCQRHAVVWWKRATFSASRRGEMVSSLAVFAPTAAEATKMPQVLRFHPPAILPFRAGHRPIMNTSGTKCPDNSDVLPNNGQEVPPGVVGNTAPTF